MRIYAFATATILAASPAFALEGRWFTGFGTNSGASMNVTIAAYGDVAELSTAFYNNRVPREALPNSFAALPDRECTYALEINGNEAQGFFTKSNSRSVTCPAQAKFSWEFNASGGLNFVTDFGADLPPLEEPYELLTILSLAQVEGQLPNENFDTLGIRPGMTRAEIEAKIIGERGWVTIKEETRSNDFFSLTPTTYASAQEKSSDSVYDTIWVRYGVVPKGEDPQNAQAVLIDRSVSYPEGQRIPLENMLAAFDKKYGPAVESLERQMSNFGANPHRAYLPDGSNDSRAAREAAGVRQWSRGCTTESLTADRRAFVAVLERNDKHSFGVGCGGDLSIQANAQDGLVYSMNIGMRDDRVGVREAWRQQSIVAASQLREVIAATKARSANTAEPEL